MYVRLSRCRIALLRQMPGTGLFAFLCGVCGICRSQRAGDRGAIRGRSQQLGLCRDWLGLVALGNEARIRIVPFLDMGDRPAASGVPAPRSPARCGEARRPTASPRASSVLVWDCPDEELHQNAAVRRPLRDPLSSDESLPEGTWASGSFLMSARFIRWGTGVGRPMPCTVPEHGEGALGTSPGNEQIQKPARCRASPWGQTQKESFLTAAPHTVTQPKG